MAIAQDLAQLVNYAKGLGFLVEFRKPPRGSQDAGFFVWQQPPKIVIHQTPRTSKRDLLLTLLHEVGHGRDYVNRGRPSYEDAEIQFAMDFDEMSKSDRQVIFNSEQRAIANMATIHAELSLGIPLYFVQAEMAFDEWVYRTFLNTGKFPANKASEEMYKKLRKKYKDLFFLQEKSHGSNE